MNEPRPGSASEDEDDDGEGHLGLEAGGPRDERLDKNAEERATEDDEQRQQRHVVDRRGGKRRRSSEQGGHFELPSTVPAAGAGSEIFTEVRIVLTVGLMTSMTGFG